MLPGDAVAPAARQFRAEDQVDAAAPEDAADRVAQLDLVVRMDPAVVVRAGIRFRRSSHRVLLVVRLRRFGSAGGRGDCFLAPGSQAITFITKARSATKNTK